MPRPPSKLEVQFADLWEKLAPSHPVPVREHKFMEKRKFQFDFAWPEHKIAVECEGGSYVRGRHTRGAGFEKDCEKYNLAALTGWTVLRYTGSMMKKEPEAIIGQIQWILEKKGAKHDFGNG